MNSLEIQALINKFASLTFEERKETNISREELDILSALYNEGDPMINPLLSDNNKLDLSYFSITNQDLRGFNFANFILKNCNFRRSRFDGESLKTILSKANSDKISLKGLDLENSDLSSQIIYDRAIGVTVDIPFNFDGMKLDRSNFAGSDLRNANFDNASLKEVIFTNANLTGASFINSDIQGANFEDAIFFPEQLATSRNFSEAIFSDPSIVHDIQNEFLELQNPQHPFFKKIRKFFASLKYTLKARVAAVAFNMRHTKSKTQHITPTIANVSNLSPQNESTVKFSEKVSKTTEKSQEKSFRK